MLLCGTRSSHRRQADVAGSEKNSGARRRARCAGETIAPEHPEQQRDEQTRGARGEHLAVQNGLADVLHLHARGAQATPTRLRQPAVRRGRCSHRAAVRAADLEQRVADLAEAAVLHRLHQRREHVVAGARAAASVAPAPRRDRSASRAWNARRLSSCACFSSSLERATCDRALRGRGGVRVLEGVHADDRQRAVVLERLVVEALFLDLARAGTASPSRRARRRARTSRSNSSSTASSTRSVSCSMTNAPWIGFSFFDRPELALDDQLDRQRAAHGLFGRRGDRLVVGVRVQAVAVVVAARAAPAAWCGCR